MKLAYSAFVTHGLLGLLWPGAPTFDPANSRDYMRWVQGRVCVEGGYRPRDCERLAGWWEQVAWQ